MGKLTSSANICLCSGEAVSFGGAVGTGAAFGYFEAFSKGFRECV